MVPNAPGCWSTANREHAITLDDILIEHGRVARFSRSETTYAAMGRFGNAFLVNGEAELSLILDHVEVVRFVLKRLTGQSERGRPEPPSS